MKISEEFFTLQGEGKYLGVPSYFIRTTGCNLRCEWQNKDGTTTICDSPYTSWQPEKGYDLDLMPILRRKEFNHVVITGGEPTIQRDLDAVVSLLLGNKKVVTIETNGTIYRDAIEGAFMSISPKLKSSYPQKGKEQEIHKKHNNFYIATKRYMDNNDYQIKFVYNEKNDLEEIIDIQEDLHIPSDKIYLMPQGIDENQMKQKQKALFEICKSYGYNYTPRLHIDIFGNRRGI